MQYCTRGSELLRNLRRSDWLPKYDDDSLRTIFAEVEEAMDKYHRESQSNDTLLASDLASDDWFKIQYRVSTIRRNGTFLYSYLENRLEKLRNLRWDSGSVLPENIQQLSLLSYNEIDFFSRYGEILNDYNEDTDFDITLDIQPPTESLIQILVLEDCGNIITESGLSMSLTKGMRLYVRKNDVEYIIRQGKCKHIK
jgi:GINS complex subunit 1